MLTPVAGVAYTALSSVQPVNVFGVAVLVGNVPVMVFGATGLPVGFCRPVGEVYRLLSAALAGATKNAKLVGGRLSQVTVTCAKL